MLDELPEKQGKGGTPAVESSGKKNTAAAATNAGKSLDINENLFKIKESGMKTEIRELEEQKIKLEQENERLKFHLDLAE